MTSGERPGGRGRRSRRMAARGCALSRGDRCLGIEGTGSFGAGLTRWACGLWPAATRHPIGCGRTRRLRCCAGPRRSRPHRARPAGLVVGCGQEDLTMRKPTAAAASAAFFMLAPGVVAGLVPWWLTGWRVRYPLPFWAVTPLRVVGAVLIVAGAVVLIQ